jgi:DsbC/DsbD-like thiol-disulfide interchange protein
MDETDFEGTVVLEQLAAIGKVDEFFDAVDSDDIQRATSLMRRAKLDASTIATVIKKMEDGDSEH